MRVVLAHGVGKTLRFLEVPAILSADILFGVPHTFGVARADGFSGVAVAALTLAGAVGLALGAELGLAPGDEVASGVALGVSAEVQPGHVGDVEVDPDSADTAASVGEFESGGGRDSVGDDFVDIHAVDARGVLAGLASISNADSSTEGVVLAGEIDLEGGVLSGGVRRQLDGGGPGRAVHVVLGLVVDGISAGGGCDADRGDQGADFGFVVGSVEVAD